MKKLILSSLFISTLSFSNSYGQSVNFTESVLPILKVSTNGKSIVNEPKTLADFQIIDNGVGKINKVNDKASLYVEAP